MYFNSRLRLYEVLEFHVTVKITALFYVVTFAVESLQ